MKITKELLERHSIGLCTEEEKKAVKEWFDTPENPSQEAQNKVSLKINRKRLWSRISRVSPEFQGAPGTRNNGTIPLHKRMMRYAAAAIILFTAGFFTYQSLSDNSLGLSGGKEKKLALKTIETQRGEKRTVTLSDGSTIQMNYETKIRVPEQFEGDERIVYLTGHAHFDVTRDTERPFIIYTEETKTEVLGTSFDINTKGKEETEVIVTSGKVIFSEKDQLDNYITLTVNDRAVLSSDHSIATSEVDASKLTAWKENKLVFDDQSLKEAIKVLERWYDVEIKVEDPELLLIYFKISLDNPSLKSALDEISFLAQFKYRIEGNTVTIYS
ncbi:MAG: FecR domain-containing protein [Bacteroidota bacterium]